MLDLSKLLFNAKVVNRSDRVFKNYKKIDLDNTLDSRILLPLCYESIKFQSKKNIDLEISNVNRTLGTILSNEITKVYKDQGLNEDTITINATGNAGNSFGAFMTKGVTINVIGDANDYFGKGLSGGKLSIRTNPAHTFDVEKNIICGNVCLYGATSGECYLDGVCGERFAVRNSGAKVVSLGCGLHGCEYMTGGVALVLGNVGRNFAAGMSGGVAYIYGKDNIKNVNTELVKVLPLDESDIKEVKDLMNNHIKYTESKYVKNILDNFDSEKFFKILPNDYAVIKKLIAEFESKGSSNPKLDAFNKFLEVK
jgi:glutamate synthase (NADPH/NADH) large chain